VKPRLNPETAFFPEFGEKSRAEPERQTPRRQGMRVPVLPLESLLKSKIVLARPKDLARIPLIRQVLMLRNMDA